MKNLKTNIPKWRSARAEQRIRIWTDL